MKKIIAAAVLLGLVLFLIPMGIRHDRLDGDGTVSRGIPEERILTEENSRTTLENLRFSRRLIEEKTENAKVAFSTSSYHVYRGGILAANSGWHIDGMGSPTIWYFWPNAFLREFIGLLVSSRLQQITAMAVIALVSAALTALVM